MSSAALYTTSAVKAVSHTSMMATRLLPLALLASRTAAGRSCDVITDCGAVADNSTNAAAAIAACAQSCGTILFPANSSFRVGSVDLSGTVNLTLQFAEGAGLYASQLQSDYPLQPALPWCDGVKCNQTQWQAVIYGRNVSGLTITGPTSARIDGLGWPWWANFSDGTLNGIQRPKLLEVVDCSGLTLEGMTWANSPFWTLHPIFCTGVVFRGVTVLAPRAVGNTDGIDPDSCTDVLVDSCTVDVGDDGISLKSGWHDVTGALMPTSNVRVVNTTVLSRNIAVGSACYGGIYNVSFEGGRVGDDDGSSPWAVKFKTHIPNGGVVSNVSFSNMRVGVIAPNTWQQPKGGTAIQLELAQYGEGEGEEHAASSSTPTTTASLLSQLPAAWPTPLPTAYTNLSFVNITVTSAVAAGSIDIQPGFGNATSGIVLAHVQYGHINGSSKSAWSCSGVEQGAVAGVDVEPPLPATCGV